MDKKIQERWEDFLNPEILRPRLISAAIYIAGFEALKDAIISRPRGLFWNPFDKSGDGVSPEYQTKVLSLNASPLYASLQWLKDEMKAFDESDIESFDRVKSCRNRISHKLLSLLGSDGLPEDFEQCFHAMVSLLHKIEVWWIVNVEIPINPDFDGQEIDEAGIQAGRVMGLKLLCDVALGDSATSRFYYEHFRKGPS